MFEAATSFKSAFYSLFNSKSHNFSEEKAHVKASSKSHLSTLKNTLYSSRPWGRECLSPPSGLVSAHEQICWPKLRMRYRMSVIYRHPVVAVSRALRFSDHVTKRNGGSGDENGTPQSQKSTHAQYATRSKKFLRRRCRIVRSLLQTRKRLRVASLFACNHIRL